MKRNKLVGSEAEFAEIGRNAIERAHAIIGYQTVFGPASTEVSNILDQAEKQERRPNKTEMGMIKTLLGMIGDTAMRLEKDLKGILQFGKALQFEMERIDVNALMVHLIEVIRAKDRFKIEFRLDLCQGLSTQTIAMDKHHIGNCVFDIVKNAVEAKAKVVTIATSTDTTPEGQFVEISVINDGELIPGDVLPHIFDFSFTTKKKGNGVGLAQVRRIVEAHGGHIDARSNTESTAFRLFLPL